LFSDVLVDSNNRASGVEEDGNFESSVKDSVDGPEGGSVLSYNQVSVVDICGSGVRGVDDVGGTGLLGGVSGYLFSHSDIFYFSPDILRDGKEFPGGNRNLGVEGSIKDGLDKGQILCRRLEMKLGVLGRRSGVGGFFWRRSNGRRRSRLGRDFYERGRFSGSGTFAFILGELIGEDSGEDSDVVFFRVGVVVESVGEGGFIRGD
jgi:hypothetical protein